VELAAGRGAGPPGSLILAAISAVFTIGYLAAKRGAGAPPPESNRPNRPACCAHRMLTDDRNARWRELDRLAALRSEILADTGAFIDARPYPAGAYGSQSALMEEIRRDGADL